MAACMILLRCIYRQGAGRSGNWKANFMGWGNWKAIRSTNFVGSTDLCSMSRGISSSAPWLMLPPSLEDDNGGKTMSYNLYSPVDKKVTRVSNRRSSITTSIGGGGDKEEESLIISLKWAMLVGSSHGWLAAFKDWRNYEPFLYNPISERQINLPSVKAIPVEDEKLINWPEKLIISESNPCSDSCRAILRYSPSCSMAVCCPGLSTEWTPFGALYHEGEEVNDFYGQPRMDRPYNDFVYSTRRKQLFCITGCDLEAWDIGDPLSPKLNWKTVDYNMDHDEENYPWHARSLEEDEFKLTCPTTQYLLFSEHSDRLFLVKRHLLEAEGAMDFKQETVSFDVHEIIIKEGQDTGGELRYMDGTLDGMAFFVGGEAQGGFVVEDPCTMDLLPNSIYYTDHIEVRTPSYWNLNGGHQLVIHDYANKTFSQFHLPGFDVPPKLNIKEHDLVRTPLWFTPSPSIFN